jgi:hypothetical protein
MVYRKCWAFNIAQTVGLLRLDSFTGLFVAFEKQAVLLSGLFVILLV